MHGVPQRVRRRIRHTLPYELAHRDLAWLERRAAIGERECRKQSLKKNEAANRDGLWCGYFFTRSIG